MAELFQDIIQELDDVEAVYFPVFIDARALVSPLEIPPSFTIWSGWPSETQCTLIIGISDRHGSTLTFEFRGNRWVSTGSGWQTFLREHEVSIGKLCVLEYVDDRCLYVKTYPRGNTRSFTKTMRISHVRPFKSTRMDIPVKFWREVGEEKFDGYFYGLQGPLTKTVVKSTLSHLPAQTVCHFTTGWSNFCKENEVKVGETLVFTHVDPFIFQVTKST
ncbi:hypothetical protein KC19_9G110400 [Ceratodon purpureus]|uniref:TF-B3 domain-containing protein n=1 Tax=Ceratodon purpureus TaxID=3225 RepID=A0A8T0GYM4_CERPU|nr:hypothetical protein KC19_9G110400 [Ceratodon purpureus]